MLVKLRPAHVRMTAGMSELEQVGAAGLLAAPAGDVIRAEQHPG